MDLVELYCSVDDFWKTFKRDWDRHLIDLGKSKRGPEPGLTTPEMMTIVILFHQSNFRTFKHFYYHAQVAYKKDFSLISYSRFVHLMKNVFVPLFAYVLSLAGAKTGIAFVDSTSIAVCKNKRISRNRVFKKIGQIGKTTTGWFFGFKLHLIINDMGEILSFQITPGNVSDVSVVESLSKRLLGKLFGDKGYISSRVFNSLLNRGLELFTSIRSTMKPKLMKIEDKILLRKRSLIETVNDQLKNISQIEHTRHRSIGNFFINLIAGIAAYCHQPKKPSLHMPRGSLVAA